MAVFPTLHNIPFQFMYFIHSSLHLLTPYPLLCPSPISSPHQFVCSLYICESVSIFLYSLVYFFTFHIKAVISNYSIRLSLTYFTKHNAHWVHPCCCKQQNCITAEWCSTEHIYHIFHTYSSVNGHLGCFHIMATVKSAAIYTGVCYIFQNVLFNHFPKKKKKKKNTAKKPAGHNQSSPLNMSVKLGSEGCNQISTMPKQVKWQKQDKTQTSVFYLQLCCFLMPWGSGGTC